MTTLILPYSLPHEFDQEISPPPPGPVTTVDDLGDQLLHADPATAAAAAEKLAQKADTFDPEFRLTVHDKFWTPIAAVGDFIEHTGTDPRNALPTGTLKLKGEDENLPTMMNCRTTLVGITVETGGQRFPFYVDVHDYEMNNKGEWTGTAHLNGIYDILNYMTVFPDWTLPIQAQLFSHAVFMGPIVTCIENMVAEAAIRIQSGLNEFINNALSLDPDVRNWYGTLLANNPNIFEALKTPMYVVRTDPSLDTSMLLARTVRMESCGAVIKDVTRAYGVDTRVDLWLPGDDQPDEWANLDQPTYVFTCKDRTPLTGPTGGPLDSILKTVVDLEGSLLGNVLDPILNPQGQTVPENNIGIYVAPALGINYVPPWVMFIAPDTYKGEKGNVLTCKITDHTPKGWRHIVGGRSPKWLNDLMNATYSWAIDSISILIGFTGIPSDLLSGFLNNTFLAFQQMDHFQRRSDVGPYHPGVEVVHATATAPYNVETIFAFINAFWDSRGWTSAQITFRNGEGYTYGRDVMRGQLASIAYLSRTKLFTDYTELCAWRVDPKTRDITAQIGDGRAQESPLGKHQRLISGAIEAINVLTLAPQSG